MQTSHTLVSVHEEEAHAFAAPVLDAESHFAIATGDYPIIPIPFLVGFVSAADFPVFSILGNGRGWPLGSAIEPRIVALR